MTTVFLTTNIGQPALDHLKSKGYTLDVFAEQEAPSKQQIIAGLRKRPDAMITNLRDPIDQDVIAAGKDCLKIIAQDSAGVDNIDLAAANRWRIPVSNTQDVLTDAVAEYALFIAGAAMRRLACSEKRVRQGLWQGWHPVHPFLGEELFDKTIGVVGTGKIGKAFVSRAAGFGVSFLLYDMHPDQGFADNVTRLLDTYHALGLHKHKQTIAYADWHTLLAESDVITVHTPLIKQGKGSTYHLLSTDAFARMKRGVCLVNTSRGPIVDEQALVKALRNGTVGYAALDVFEKEPLPLDSPLRAEEFVDRVRLYHHFASGGRISRLSLDPDKGMAGRCITALIRVLEGEDPADIPYVVNRNIFR